VILSLDHPDMNASSLANILCGINDEYSTLALVYIVQELPIKESVDIASEQVFP
jgi:hypothetical protein